MKIEDLLGCILKINVILVRTLISSRRKKQCGRVRNVKVFGMFFCSEKWQIWLTEVKVILIWVTEAHIISKMVKTNLNLILAFLKYSKISINPLMIMLLCVTTETYFNPSQYYTFLAAQVSFCMWLSFIFPHG